MKKLLKWICHPALCWRYTMDKEKFVEMYGEFKGMLVDKLPNVGTVEVFQVWQIVGDNFIFG